MFLLMLWLLNLGREWDSVAPALLPGRADVMCWGRPRLELIQASCNRLPFWCTKMNGWADLMTWHMPNTNNPMNFWLAVNSFGMLFRSFGS